MHRNALSFWPPVMVRTTGHCSWYLARQPSTQRLDITTAEQPRRNRQFGSSMPRSLPKYQFWVMFSVETTTAYVLLCTCSRRAARSIAMRPAEQPMPPKLKCTISCRILKWLMIILQLSQIGDVGCSWRCSHEDNIGWVSYSCKNRYKTKGARCKGRQWVEEAAVDNQNAYLLRLDPSLVEDVAH